MPFETNSGLPYPRGRRLPCRMNLIKITFLPLDVEGTPKDKDFRQAIRLKKRFNEVTIKGQINFGTKQKKFFQSISQSPSIAWNTPGDMTQSIGAALFRRRELEAAKFMPKKGDLVIKFGDYTPPEGMQMQVEEVRPESYLNGVPLLFYCELRRDKDYG